MPREIEGVRDVVADIRERYPDIEIFMLQDVAMVTKKSKHFVKDNIMPDTKCLHIVELAKRLCLLSRGQKVVTK